MIIFWLRLWRETRFQSPCNMSALRSSICHAASLSKSFGRAAYKAINLGCITIVSVKCFLILLLLINAATVTTEAEKWDNRQEQWDNADAIFLIIEVRLTPEWKVVLTVLVITLIVEHASHTGWISRRGSWSVRLHCNRTPIQAASGADDQSRVQVQQRCALA